MVSGIAVSDCLVRKSELLLKTFCYGTENKRTIKPSDLCELCHYGLAEAYLVIVSTHYTRPPLLKCDFADLLHQDVSTLFAFEKLWTILRIMTLRFLKRFHKCFLRIV